MRSIRLKSGKMVPVADSVTDFVETDIADVPNLFKQTGRDFGYGWYEYETRSLVFNHKVNEKTIINEPLEDGVIKRKHGYRRRY